MILQLQIRTVPPVYMRSRPVWWWKALYRQTPARLDLRSGIHRSPHGSRCQHPLWPEDLGQEQLRCKKREEHGVSHKSLNNIIFVCLATSCLKAQHWWHGGWVYGSECMHMCPRTTLTCATLVKWPYISVSETVNLTVGWNSLNSMLGNQVHVHSPGKHPDRTRGDRWRNKRDKDQRQLVSVWEKIPSYINWNIWYW